MHPNQYFQHLHSLATMSDPLGQVRVHPRKERFKWMNWPAWMVMMAFRDELLEYPTLNRANRARFRVFVKSVLEVAYRAWEPQDDWEWARGFKRQAHLARAFRRALVNSGLSPAKMAPDGRLPVDFHRVWWEFQIVNGLIEK